MPRSSYALRGGYGYRNPHWGYLDSLTRGWTPPTGLLPASEAATSAQAECATASASGSDVGGGARFAQAEMILVYARKAA